MTTKNIFSIDVEDWFHILDISSTPSRDQWDSLPSRVEKYFIRLLDILDEHGVSSTCFCLSWIAQRFPHLIQDAAKRGHEIASHGASHQLIYSQTQKEFYNDIAESKKILEDTIQKPVYGYRAPGFSVTEKTPWVFETLIEAGYTFDSSIFPASRGHGGLENGNPNPHVIVTQSGTLREFPITTSTFMGKRYCFSGGGYFRLFPYWLIAKETRRINSQGNPVVVYIHPRDIDPDQPRLKMGVYRYMKTYIRLPATEPKLKRLFSDFAFTNYAHFQRMDIQSN